jgi:hypothetical protein
MSIRDRLDYPTKQRATSIVNFGWQMSIVKQIINVYKMRPPIRVFIIHMHLPLAMRFANSSTFLISSRLTKILTNAL